MNYFELIEGYKNDRLTKFEKSEFETEMRQNEALSKAILNHDEAMAALDKLMEDDIRKQVVKVKNGQKKLAVERIHSNGWDKKQINGSIKKTRTGKMTLLRYAAAALLLILISATIVLTNTLSKKTPEQIYASYHSFYPNNESPTRAMNGTDISTLRLSAYTAYDQKNLAQVIEILSALPPGYDKEVNDVFYTGLSHMELGHWGDAVPLLEKVAGSVSQYKSDAKWYLALALLRTDECVKAIEYFSEIKDASLDRSIEAGEILGRIRC